MISLNGSVSLTSSLKIVVKAGRAGTVNVSTVIFGFKPSKFLKGDVEIVVRVISVLPSLKNKVVSGTPAV
ncbi:MAG: hypothetical protein QXO24_03075, partial [Candidatus Micrarchaeaceae archaeon]